MDFTIQSHPINDGKNRNDLYFSETMYRELGYPQKVIIKGIEFSPSGHVNVKDDCIGITSYYRSRLTKAIGDKVSLQV
jgi:hypothetical protein